MKKIFFYLLPVFVIAAFFWACQKDYSITSTSTPTTTTPVIGYVTPYFQWIFSVNDTGNYSGCVDMAYIIRTPTISGDTTKQLYITGGDTLGNSFQLTYQPASGSFTKGIYNGSNGASFTYTDGKGIHYFSNNPNSLTLKIISVNDSIIALDFTDTLINTINSHKVVISNGQLRAKISGKTVACNSYDSTINGSSSSSSSDMVFAYTKVKAIGIDTQNVTHYDSTITTSGYCYLKSNGTMYGVNIIPSGIGWTPETGKFDVTSTPISDTLNYVIQNNMLIMWQTATIKDTAYIDNSKIIVDAKYPFSQLEVISTYTKQ